MIDARYDLIDAVGDDFIYADNTLVVDDRYDFGSIYMKCILKLREYYGLTFNQDKLYMICINCDPIIAKPSGCNITSFQSTVYLGGVISADG